VDSPICTHGTGLAKFFDRTWIVNQETTMTDMHRWNEPTVTENQSIDVSAVISCS